MLLRISLALSVLLFVPVTLAQIAPKSGICGDHKKYRIGNRLPPCSTPAEGGVRINLGHLIAVAWHFTRSTYIRWKRDRHDFNRRMALQP